MEQNSFSFSCRPEVVYGEGALAQVPSLAKKLGGSRALVVADPFFPSTPHFAILTKTLADEGIQHILFSEIAGEPATETGDRCAEAGRKAGADIVIGIGGGSALDVAKAAAVLITNGGTVREYQGLNRVPGPGLPKIMVPTTAGTGSEVTFTAVFIRSDEKKKGGINSPYLYPEAAVLDPLLTVSMPPAVTASTGLDALCHAVESYTSRRANLLTEAVSLAAISLIWKNLPLAWADGTNIAARSSMLYGSFLAGVGLANAGVTAVHSISYPLGGTFGVPHGVGNGILLAPVLEHNLPAVKEKLAAVMRAVDPAFLQTTDDEAARAFIRGIRQFVDSFGLPRLSEYGVSEKDLPHLAQDALAVAVPIANNPRPVDADAIVRIYSAVLNR